MSAPAIPRDAVTGLLLAGGQGSRMGGVDKGLQAFGGGTLAQHALERLRPQVNRLIVNANRHPDVYQGFGVPVVADELTGYAGPLAGFLAGLQHCQTDYLVTVPCDTPLFPTDLVARLAAALAAADADIAMAAAPEADDHGQMTLRTQPVFCLLKRGLLDSLRAFTASGRRKIDMWTAQHHCVTVAFDGPGDDPQAFANANTFDELRAIAAQRPAGPPA